MTFRYFDLLGPLDEHTAPTSICAPEDHAAVEEVAAFCEHARNPVKAGRPTLARSEVRRKLQNHEMVSMRMYGGIQE